MTQLGSQGYYLVGYEAGIKSERERIIKLLEEEILKHTKVLELSSNRKDTDHRHTICRIYQSAIDLIKKANL